MTLRSSIGSKESPRKMFSTLLAPYSQVSAQATGQASGQQQASGCGCGGGCRARALTRLNREGMAACQAGAFDDARRLLSQGVGLAHSAGTTMYEAKIRNNLGLVHLLADSPREAAREFGEALTLVEDKLGRDNPLYKKIQGNLDKAAIL